MTVKPARRKSAFRLFLATYTVGLLISVVAVPLHAQYVHQLSSNGSNWIDQGLTGVPVDWYTGLGAFLTTPNDQIHAYYLTGPGTGDDLCSVTDHVHQLFYNGTSWQDDDLTMLSGGPPAAACTTVTGFSVGNYQYVYFVAADASIHQLLYNNFNWTDSNLTVLSGAPQCQCSNVLAFTTTPAVHIYYTAYPVFHVHQIFTPDGTRWQDQDLTEMTGGPNGPDLPYQLAGFNIGNLQYVYFLSDTDGHIHQFFYNNSSWSNQDLTAITKTTTEGYATSVAALVLPGTKKMRVYFNNGNGHILQLSSFNNAKWAALDLSKKSKGPIVWEQAGILALAGPKNLVNVYYDSGSDVNRIFQTTSSTWSNEDLTLLTNGGNIDNFYRSPIVGFSLQNNQNIFYVADQ
jgi:hypothetical protein